MPRSYAPKFAEKEKSIKLPLVRDLMIKKLISFQADQEVHDAMQILMKKGISGGPVLARNGALLGMLTERDCIKVLKQELMHSQPAARQVSELMSTDVLSIEPDMNMFEAAALFTEKNVRRIPVVENKKVIGQLHRRDVLTQMAKMRKKIQ